MLQATLDSNLREVSLDKFEASSISDPYFSIIIAYLKSLSLSLETESLKNSRDAVKFFKVVSV